MDKLLLKRDGSTYEYLYWVPKSLHWLFGSDPLTVRFQDIDSYRTTVQVFRFGKLQVQRKSITRPEVKLFMSLLHRYKIPEVFSTD